MILRAWERFWRFCCPRKVFRAESLLGPTSIRGRLTEANSKPLNAVMWLSRVFDPFRLFSGFVEDDRFELQFGSAPGLGSFFVLPSVPPTVVGSYKAGDIGTHLSLEFQTHAFVRLWFGGAVFWTITATLSVLAIAAANGRLWFTTQFPWGDEWIEVPVVILVSMSGLLFCSIGVLMSRISWWLHFQRVKSEIKDLIQASSFAEVREKNRARHLNLEPGSICDVPVMRTIMVMDPRTAQYHQVATMRLG